MTKIFRRCRKLNIFLALIKQSYFKVLKRYFTMKVPSKRELQNSQLIMYQILTLKTLLTSDNLFHFRQNL